MPSANAENAARCVPAWQKMGYRVAILQDRTPVDVPCDAKIMHDKYPGWAASINMLYREIVSESCPVVVGGGDDLYPDPSLRAEVIARQFLERFPDTLGVMQPIGDPFEATQSICGSPWLGRAWMRRMYDAKGGLCDRYFQQYADEELYWVARAADRLWVRPDLAQCHEHFRRVGKPAPKYWVESAAANEAKDCATFIERLESGFPGAAPQGMLDLGIIRTQYDGRAHDRYRTVLAPGALNDEATRRLADAFDRLAKEGARSIAVFGAGQHTHRAERAFGESPVRISAIIDDDPARIGTRLFGSPIISADEALARASDFDAIVLSSDAMEQRLLERAGPLARRGVRILTLYHDRPPAYTTKSGAA